MSAQHGLIILVGTLDSQSARLLIAMGEECARERKVQGLFGRFEDTLDDPYGAIPFKHSFTSPARSISKLLEDSAQGEHDILIVEQIADRKTAGEILTQARKKLIIAGVFGLDVFSASDRYADMGISVAELIEQLSLVISHQLKTKTYQILEVGERQREVLNAGHYTEFHKLDLDLREVSS